MADQQTMSTGDALNELAKFKNVFRAAENVEGVLLSVQRLEATKADLAREISDLQAQAEKANDDMNKVLSDLAEKQKALDDYETELDRKFIAAKDKYDADMVELAAHYSQTSVAARDKVAADLKAEQDKVDELVARKSDLQRDVRMLEAQLQVLKDQIAAMPGPIPSKAAL